MDKIYLDLIRRQKLITIATVNSNSNPWICNVYYVYDENNIIYFLSSTETRHSEHIEKNYNAAFTTVWFNEKKLSDRKAIQGTGTIEIVKNIGELLHSIKFIHLNLEAAIKN